MSKEQGKALSHYRVLACFTQQKLGEALGFRGRTACSIVQRWEYGFRPIPLKHWRKLHDLIGIPYDKLVP